MDDPRWEPGMPVLDRQPLREPAARAADSDTARGARTGGRATGPRVAGVPDRIPETAPTPLQPYYINLSAVALVAGAIAITALETGAPLGSALVKLCALIAGPLLLLANGDAVLRIWRSAWAWMPVDRGRGLFRLTWVLAGTIGLLAIAAGSALVLLA